MVLEVLNRFRREGWDYDRVDLMPSQPNATLHLKRRLAGGASSAESFTASGMEPGPFHPHARRWTVADDDVVRTNSARDAARLLDVSIATIYVRRHTLGIRAHSRPRAPVAE
jgi:hypothetical protein